MESSLRDLLNDVAEHRSTLKITKIRITPLYFKIGLSSAPSMESSRRDLLNDMAEHRSTLKITKIRITPFYFKIGLCSATSMESPLRDLLNDVAEHRSIFKTDQSTYYPRFSFMPKTGILVPKIGVLFLLRFSGRTLD